MFSTGELAASRQNTLVKAVERSLRSADGVSGRDKYNPRASLAAEYLQCLSPSFADAGQLTTTVSGGF